MTGSAEYSAGQLHSPVIAFTADQKVAISITNVTHATAGDSSSPVTAYTVRLKGSYHVDVRLGDLQRNAMRIPTIAMHSEPFQQLAAMQGQTGITVGPYTSQFSDLEQFLTVDTTRVEGPGTEHRQQACRGPLNRDVGGSVAVGQGQPGTTAGISTRKAVEEAVRGQLSASTAVIQASRSAPGGRRADQRTRGSAGQCRQLWTTRRGGRRSGCGDGQAGCPVPHEPGDQPARRRWARAVSARPCRSRADGRDRDRQSGCLR
jgi:hypothetical protein